MTMDLPGRIRVQHCQYFAEGLKLLKEESISQALLLFQRAYHRVPRNDLYHNKYASFYGLARVLAGDESGLELCRSIARHEDFDGDVFLNLAYAEWYMKSRKRSVDALEEGLQVDRFHPGLNKLKQRLGERKRQPIECIPRNSFLNVALGKLSRRKENQASWDYSHLLSDEMG